VTTLAEDMGQVVYRRRRVVLDCGATIYFANANLAPRKGEVVPCLRHGYCCVEEVEPLVSSATLRTRRRAPRRTVTELLVHMQKVGTCTVSQLRLERFTLRLVDRAARDGLVDVEARGGTLLVHVRGARDAGDVPASETSSGYRPHRLRQSW